MCIRDSRVTDAVKQAPNVWLVTYQISGSTVAGTQTSAIFTFTLTHNGGTDFSRQITGTGSFAATGTCNVWGLADPAPGTQMQMGCNVERQMGEGGSKFLPVYVGASKTVRISLLNSTDYGKTYKLIQNGVEVASQYVAPHSGGIYEITVPSDAEVRVVESVEGLQHDGPSWVEVPGSTTEVKSPPGSPILNPQSPVTPPPAPAVIPESPDVPNKQPNGGGSGSWNPAQGTNTSDVLTGSVYREGIEKILAKMGTGGAGVGDGLTNDTFNRAMTDTQGKTEEEAPKMPGEEGGPQGNLHMNSGQVVGLLAKLPPQPSISAPGTTSTFVMDTSLPGVGGTYNFGFDLSRWATPISIFRAFIASLLTLGYFYLAVKEIRNAFAG